MGMNRQFDFNTNATVFNTKGNSGATTEREKIQFMGNCSRGAVLKEKRSLESHRAVNGLHSLGHPPTAQELP